MREVETFPNSLNPQAQGSMDLVQDMLTQVMKKHPEAKWFHIGADEVSGSLKIVVFHGKKENDKDTMSLFSF